MSKEILIILIEQNLSTYEIADKLNMSQTGVRYWLRKHGLNTKRTVTENRGLCSVCGSALRGSQSKFCSKKCKDEKYTSNPNSYLCQQIRAKKRKLKLIDMKGGGCEICGYNKNYAALTFHHIDPRNKSFTLDSRKCSNTNWKSLLLELAKCRLLCQNCHCELHFPSLIIEKVHAEGT